MFTAPGPALSLVAASTRLTVEMLCLGKILALSSCVTLGESLCLSRFSASRLQNRRFGPDYSVFGFKILQASLEDEICMRMAFSDAPSCPFQLSLPLCKSQYSGFLQPFSALAGADSKGHWCWGKLARIPGLTCCTNIAEDGIVGCRCLGRRSQ